MDYRLSIEVELDLSQNEYSDLLQANEIPRGLVIPVNFYVTNLGEPAFNGTIKQLGYLFNKSNSDFVDITKDNSTPSIRDLAGKNFNDRRPFYQNSINILEEGSGWFKCVLKPYNEGDKIEYFTNNGNKSLGMESWSSQIFQVVNREQLEIIKLLREIRDKMP